MPIYNYHCVNCKESFEVEKKIKDACKEERCECGAVAIKQITPKLAIFRGGKDWTKHNNLEGGSKK